MKENMNGENVYYKPSGNFSIGGALLIALITAIAGSILFAGYILLNNYVSSVKLIGLVAILVCGLIGWLSSRIIKAFKIRNILVAIVFSLIGFLIATYFKWAFYDYLDYQKYNVKVMKNTSAYEYYNFKNLFENEKDTDKINTYLTIYKATKEYELVSQGIISDTKFSDSDKARMKSESIWVFNNYDKLLGDSASDVKISLEKSKKTNAYEYCYTYRKFGKASTFINFIKPTTLFEDIKNINAEGRWSYSSTSYSADKGTLVNGVELWIVWGAEFGLMLLSTMVMVISAAKKPFIESENQWAVNIGELNQRLVMPTDIKQFKRDLEVNPRAILDSLPTDYSQISSAFMTASFYVSRSKKENYMTLITVKPNGKNKVSKSTILTNLRVDDVVLNGISTYKIPEHMETVVQTMATDSTDFEQKQHSDES